MNFHTTKRRIVTLLLAMTAAALAGCTTTEMTSFVDPAYDGERFEKILVSTNYDDLIQADHLEQAMVKELQREGATATASLAEFPPTRQRPAGGEQSGTAQQRGYDALLEVHLIAYEEEVAYIPPTYYVHEIENRNRDRGGFTTSWSTVSASPGRTVRYPRPTHRLTLHNLESGETVWIAEAFSSGDANIDVLFDALAKEAVRRMRSDGVLSSQ